MRKPQIMYLSQGDLFILKLVGKLRFTIAPHLEKAMALQKEAMYGKEIIIDFTDVDYADSTILGIITGFFLRENKQSGMLSQTPTILCNAPDMKKILCNIGFDKFFNFKDRDKRVSLSYEKYTVFDELPQGDQDIEDSVIKAHQPLREAGKNKSAYDLVVKPLKKESE